MIRFTCMINGYVRVYSSHRTRIKTEERANVVAAVWGIELIKFLAALYYFTSG